MKCLLLLAISVLLVSDVVVLNASRIHLSNVLAPNFSSPGHSSGDDCAAWEKDLEVRYRNNNKSYGIRSFKAVLQMLSKMNTRTMKNIGKALTVTGRTDGAVAKHVFDAMNTCIFDIKTGRTIYMELIRQGLISVLNHNFVKKLAPAATHQKDKEGNNVIQLAVKSSNDDVVQQVLEQFSTDGLRMLEEKNNEGQTGRDLAIAERRSDILHTLSAYYETLQAGKSLMEPPGGQFGNGGVPGGQFGNGGVPGGQFGNGGVPGGQFGNGGVPNHGNTPNGNGGLGSLPPNSQHEEPVIGSDMEGGVESDASDSSEGMEPEGITQTPDAQRGAGMPQHGAGGPGMPQHDAGGPGMSQHGAGGAGMPQHGAGAPGMPQHGAGGPGMPQHGAGGPGMPQHGAGGAGMPQHGAGGAGMPQHGAGGAGMPQHGAGGAGMPQHGAGGAGMPQHGAGGAGMPYSGPEGTWIPAGMPYNGVGAPYNNHWMPYNGYGPGAGTTPYHMPYNGQGGASMPPNHMPYTGGMPHNGPSTSGGPSVTIYPPPPSPQAKNGAAPKDDKVMSSVVAFFQRNA